MMLEKELEDEPERVGAGGSGDGKEQNDQEIEEMGR